MGYAALEKKLAYYHKNKHLMPDAVTQNYEAAFRVDYTHNSTAIEGNTLSLMETKLLLEDAITPGGKRLREIYEVVNHSKAFGYASRCVADGKALDKNIVKDIHAILMENIMTGGVYRNTNVYITGARHAPPPPDEAFRQLGYFYSDMGENRQKMHAIEFAAWTHAEFVKIHPFVDGNGRTSRLMMNYQLASADYLPVSIPVARRLEYFETLEAYACEGDLLPFAALVCGLEEARLDLYIAAIEQIVAEQLLRRGPMRFGENVFYDTNNLNMDEKTALLRDCKEICLEWRADKLDCSVSFSRQGIDCSFEEILGRLKEDSHFVVIDRGTWGGFRIDDKEHFEIAFRTMDSPIDYFLFIQVDSEKMPPILEKYRLTRKA